MSLASTRFVDKSCHVLLEENIPFSIPLKRRIIDTFMTTNIEKGIIFVTAKYPIDSSSLGPNEYFVTSHCKLIYVGLPDDKPTRREMNVYRKVINGLDAILEGRGDFKIPVEKLSKT